MEEYNEHQAWIDLGNLGLPFFRTGSREICSPPPLNTDVDFVVLDIENVGVFEKNGFLLTTIEDTKKYGNVDFHTYRRGEVNLIVVDNRRSFFDWKRATAAAKKKNVKSKFQRIALFQGILYGNW